MLRISYDIKPIPSNIKRMRLNVIDSFINKEIIDNFISFNTKKEIQLEMDI